MTQRVLCAFGTRPEAIKMAPVYLALQKHAELEPQILLTGQHREQLQQALALFGLPVVQNLEVMGDRQSLTDLAARILPLVSQALRDLRPAHVLVHGDTLTTFAVAWAAFLERVPVSHVEAGLRSDNMAEPFPEEANRRLTDVVADLCLAPTSQSRNNLLAEHVASERIIVTGQTGIDAIRLAAKSPSSSLALPPGPYITVTMHRRENWPLLTDMATAIRDLARRYSSKRFVYPVHLNPIVRSAVFPVLGNEPNVTLCEPLDYGQMAHLLVSSELLITDSGGLQEEGAALNIPVIVLRNVTERPEGIATGALKLAGTSRDGILSTVANLLDDPAAYALMRRARNPYGDGRASERVAQAIVWRLGLGDRPDDWE